MSTKLRYLFTLICSICLFTACGDDDDKGEGGGGDTTWEQVAGSYEGDKLAFSYGETTLTGKKATFTATNSTNGSLALTNVIPGEETTTISDIKVENSAFSGTAATTNANVEYTGSVKDDVMTLKLNVVMKDPNGWAKTYNLADYSAADGAVQTGAMYVNWQAEGTNADAVGDMVRAVGGILLPQVLQSVTLEADGNITASYHKGPITFDPALIPGLLGGVVPTSEEVKALIPTSGWLESPKHLAYWFAKDNKMYVKLNITSIISQVMGADAGDLSGIISSILQGDVATIKGLIGGLAGIDVSSISDETFEMLLDWVNNGVPMNISNVDGRTQMYLDKAALTPLMADKTLAETQGMNADLIKIWNMLAAAKIIPQEASSAFLLLLNFPQNWDATTEFGLGLDLVAQ